MSGYVRGHALAPRAWTRLPNASTLGYGEWRARPGDFLCYCDPASAGPGGEGRRVEYARVLGRIVDISADGLEDCRGWLAVVTVDSGMAGGYERWIRPEWVTHCERPAHVGAFFRAFFRASVSDLKRALEANAGHIAAGRDGRVWEGKSGQ